LLLALRASCAAAAAASVGAELLLLLLLLVLVLPVVVVLAGPALSWSGCCPGQHEFGCSSAVCTA
jgi:hypothetical protein